MKVGIIGFGAFGKQLLHFLIEEYEEAISEVIVFDDTLTANDTDEKYNVLPFGDYTKPDFKDVDFYIGLGYKQLEKREKIIEQLAKEKKSVPAFVHQTCYINPSAQIEQACYLFPRCNIDMNVVLKQGVVLNNSVVVSHHSVIGVSSFLAPGVCICGNVNIGMRSFIGAASTVSNNVSIGHDVIIGIGSVVTKDIPSFASAIGNPAKVLNNKIELQ